jgi:hypothetical protein
MSPAEAGDIAADFLETVFVQEGSVAGLGNLATWPVQN